LGSSLLPASIDSRLAEAFRAWTWRPGGWDAEHASDYLSVVLLMAISLGGFVAAMRALFASLFPSRPCAASITSLAALACLPVFFGPFSRQIYDFTTLWLFALAFALIARGRWPAFATLFPFACLNKETAILLTLVFVVHQYMSPTQISSVAFRRLLAYQIAVFLIVRAAVVYTFRDNPGGTVEFHLFGHNWQVLLHPTWMSKRLLLLLGAAGVGVWGWRQKPALLRNALLALGPTLLLMGLTVGQLDEIRAYYEVYPIVVLLFAETVCRLMGVPLVSAENFGTAAPSQLRPGMAS
jgi:hypothetical protein